MPRIYFISNLNGKKSVAKFYEKEMQKTNKKKIRIETVIEKNVDKLHVEWKDYDN